MSSVSKLPHSFPCQPKQPDRQQISPSIEGISTFRKMGDDWLNEIIINCLLKKIKWDITIKLNIYEI